MSDFFNNHAVEIFGLINTVLVAFILPMLSTWLRAHLNEKRARLVESAARSGINAAIQSLTKGKTSGETIKAVLTDDTVRQNVVDLANDYVHATVPTAIKKLGVEDETANIISARVEGVVADLADKYITANRAIAVASDTKQATGGAAAV